MRFDWHEFMAIYDRCIRFGAVLDDDMDYITKAANVLQPESLALVLVRRVERRLMEAARQGDDADA
jgi:hypothetical protein